MTTLRSSSPSWCKLLLIIAAWQLTPRLHGQTLTWDATPASPGVQNGAGTWNTSTANWIDSLNANVTWANSGLEIAQFGSGAAIASSTVLLNSATLNLAGINFLGFSAAPGSGSQYTLAGGTLNFGTNGLIQMADLTSGGSQFVTFSTTASPLTLSGTNLTVQKSGGSTIQFTTFAMASNPSLTGTLTIPGTNGGIFLRSAAAGTFSGMSRVIVGSGSAFSVSGGGNYTMPLSLAGTGGVNAYGAVRVDNSNTTLSGGITLTADAGIQTNTGGVTGTIISAPIGESGGSFSFSRWVTGTGTGTMILTAANTYTGATTLGRTGTFAGGITSLDFSAAGAPQNDILYNGAATAGALNMIGGNNSTTTLIMNGKAGTNNLQRLGNVTLSSTRTMIQVDSGTGGTATLSLGTLTRSGSVLAGFVTPASGSITTTSPDGVLGPWASHTSAAGVTTWAQISGGKITGGYVGDTSYVSATDMGALPATVTTNLTISATSTGGVSQAAGTTFLNTVSMTDATADRVVPVGSGNTLRLGIVGGVQLVSGARSLTIGTSAGTGSLSAGGTTGTATGQLILSNYSSNGVLTVNSSITNNTSGAVALAVNSMPGGKVVLAGTNTYTGGTTLARGEVEVQNVAAFGTTGTVTVMEGASVTLPAGLPAAFTRAMTIAGDGLNGEGVIRSLGTNTISGALTQVGPSRITATEGTLTIQGAAPDTLLIAGGHTVTFAGAGTIVLGSRFGATAATGLSASMTKDGTGTLILRGSSNYTATTTVNSGVMQLDFSPASTPASNLLYNGLASPGAVVLAGGTLQLNGKSAATNSQALGSLTLSNYSNLSFTQNGAASLSLSMTTISRGFGSILGIDLPASGTLTTTGGVSNTILSAGSRAFAFIRDAINGDEWAGTDATATNRNIVKLSALSTGGYTASTASALAGNANVAAGVTTTTLAGSGTTTLTSLRFGQTQATTITQSATGRVIATGGILVSSTVGANTSTISVSTLRAPSSSTNTDLPIIQNNPSAPLVITAAITNASDGASGTVVSSLAKAGTGVLELRGANTFTGNLRVYEGTVQFAAGSHSSSVEYLLGSGTNNGKVVLGSGAAAFNNSVDYISVVGTGTGNSIVGGASVVSELTLAGSADVSNFATGMLGGTGTNENNLAITMSNTAGRALFGPANTYAGQTSIRNGIVEASVLADGGTASSLGTGALNPVIDMGGSTVATPVGTLRYTGVVNSTSNRVINLANSSTSTAITGVIENNGTGILVFTNAFTSTGTNTTGTRTLRLTGRNTGANQIAGIGNNGANGTVIEKTGTGTWAITGNSAHAGGTNVLNGTLLLSNGSGSGTGTGSVAVSAGATLGGTGRSAPSANGSVTLTGATLSAGDSTLSAVTASMLTIETSGTGSLSLLSASTIALDLISGAGTGDHTLDALTADRLVVLGAVTLGVDATLRLGNPMGLSSFAVGDAWRLFDWAALNVTGTFTNYDLPALSDGLNWDKASLYTDGVIRVGAVPEPSRAVLIAMTLGTLAFRRRRS